MWQTGYCAEKVKDSVMSEERMEVAILTEVVR